MREKEEKGKKVKKKIKRLNIYKRKNKEGKRKA